ncbi:unnamed protein product, partial [Ectocarpus sp. 6 AP-2014]
SLPLLLLLLRRRRLESRRDFPPSSLLPPLLLLLLLLRGRVLLPFSDRWSSLLRPLDPAPFEPSPSSLDLFPAAAAEEEERLSEVALRPAREEPSSEEELEPE